MWSRKCLSIGCIRGGCHSWRWKSSSSYVTSYPPKYFEDPTIELQRYLKMPLFGDNEKPFLPTIQEIQSSARRFVHVPHDNEIRFLTSAVELTRCPPDEQVPEVIFLGESNVGKSSLIKALLTKTDVLVKVSSKPGHTKTLNFYKVGKKLRIVDVPGYGFKQPKHYVQSVETYLKYRKCLCRTFLLADASIGLSEWDITAFQMLEEFKIPYALVLTKIDLAVTSSRLMNLMKLQELRDKVASNWCFPQPFLVSSKTLEGLGHLQAFIVHVTAS